MHKMQASAHSPCYYSILALEGKKEKEKKASCVYL